MDHAARIVARGAVAGQAVEEFQPVWYCAALRIARAAWAGSGLEVFLRQDVPYGATSSGRLSADAVSLLHNSAARRGDAPLRFLELGAGSGLFARLFLDMLREAAPALYETCTYIVTDAHQTMLDSQAEYGVFAEHPGRVRAMVFDAAARWPAEFDGGFDAIFGNYILDSLPAELLSIGPAGLRRMMARCALPKGETGADALAAALRKPGDLHLAAYLRFRKRLHIQTELRPTAPDALPWPGAIGDLPEDDDIPMVHCTGALTCLANIARHLRKGGFAMLTDYGTLAPREPSDQIEFQSFGASAAHAVNFHQLDWVGEGGGFGEGLAWLRPEAEEGQLITRLLYHGPAEDLADQVDLLFGETRQRALRLPIEAARELLRANAYEAARRLYLKALALQPQNWALAEEIATYLLLPAGNLQDACDLADAALRLNPYSPALHRIRATALFELGDLAAARAALDIALRYHAQSPESQLLRARLDLAAGAHGAALQAIATALEHDAEAEHREALLALQDEVLRSLSTTARQHLLDEVNQIRPLDDLPN